MKILKEYKLSVLGTNNIHLLDLPKNSNILSARMDNETGEIRLGVIIDSTFQNELEVHKILVAEFGKELATNALSKSNFIATIPDCATDAIFYLFEI